MYAKARKRKRGKEEKKKGKKKDFAHFTTSPINCATSRNVIARGSLGILGDLSRTRAPFFPFSSFFVVFVGGIVKQIRLGSTDDTVNRCDSIWDYIGVHLNGILNN